MQTSNAPWPTRPTLCPKKTSQSAIVHIYIGRFKNILSPANPADICNKAVTKSLSTSQTCLYTILQNLNIVN